MSGVEFSQTVWVILDNIPGVVQKGDANAFIFRNRSREETVHANRPKKHFLTKRVRDALVEAGVTNVKLNPITELELMLLPTKEPPLNGRRIALPKLPFR